MTFIKSISFWFFISIILNYLLRFSLPGVEQPLESSAGKQTGIAADNIAGGNSTYKETLGTSVLNVFGMTATGTVLYKRIVVNCPCHTTGKKGK